MTAPINPRYPLTEVQSVEELMGIAIAMEREAAIRYDQLAELVARHGDAELAATFRQLAELERRHEAGLGAWAQREGLSGLQAKQFSWALPETFSAEDAGGAPLSPYQALGIAVRNEERAFTFYTYLAALADTQGDVRQRAEALAREELNHVAQLRHLRRRAYHSERRERRSEAAAISTLADLRRLAWGMERGSADLTALAARHLESDGNGPGALLLRHASREAASRADTLAALAGGGDAPMGSRIFEDARNSGLLTAEASKRVFGFCERDTREVLDAYLSVADHAREEALLHAAQDLAEGAVARLALIRSQANDAGTDS